MHDVQPQWHGTKHDQREREKRKRKEKREKRKEKREKRKKREKKIQCVDWSQLAVMPPYLIEIKDHPPLPLPSVLFLLLFPPLPLIVSMHFGYGHGGKRRGTMGEEGSGGLELWSGLRSRASGGCLSFRWCS